MFASGVKRVTQADAAAMKSKKTASDVYVQIHGNGKYNV